jgi:hypothetical protein
VGQCRSIFSTRMVAWLAVTLLTSRRTHSISRCLQAVSATLVRVSFTKQEMLACFRNADRLSFDQFQRQIEGKTTGVLWAESSPSLMSTPISSSPGSSSISTYPDFDMPPCAFG